MSDLSEDNEGKVGDGGRSGCAQESRLTDVDVQAFLENDVSDTGEMARVRRLGLTGRAYSRYLKILGVKTEQSMSQLAACGISTYTYESFLNIGVSDVFTVCRLHLGGWTADRYQALTIELRETTGQALYDRMLRCHHAPTITLSYIKSSVKFANWILCLSESELGPVVAKCERDDPGVAFFSSKHGF